MNIASISSFSGRHSFLSNFDMTPVTVRAITWKGVEVWFQFAKKLDPLQPTITAKDLIALSRRDPRDPKKMVNVPWTELGPRDAKKLGRLVNLRPDWERVKEQIMLEGLRAKFSQNPALRHQLLQTRDAHLVEGNYWHDNVWGSCTCPLCQDKPHHNKLGILLMQVRTEILHGDL